MSVQLEIPLDSLAMVKWGISERIKDRKTGNDSLLITLGNAGHKDRVSY